MEPAQTLPEGNVGEVETHPQRTQGRRNSCPSVTRPSPTGPPGTRLPEGDEHQPLDPSNLLQKPVRNAYIWIHRAALLAVSGDGWIKGSSFFFKTKKGHAQVQSIQTQNHA